MDHQLISRTNLLNLLTKLQEAYSVILPVRKGESRFYEPLASVDNHFAIGEVRASEPLKAFFFQARQRVAERSLHRRFAPGTCFCAADIPSASGPGSTGSGPLRCCWS